MAFTQSASIEVKRFKGKGRGVFARRLIRKGELIEKVPMLVLSVEEYHEGLGKTSLANYCFNWKEGTVALALGYGSLYNHSYWPNARYEDVGPQTKDLTALWDIEPGEEITVNLQREAEEPIGGLVRGRRRDGHKRGEWVDQREGLMRSILGWLDDLL